MATVESEQIRDLIERKNASVGRIAMRILIGFEAVSLVVDRFVILSPTKLAGMTYHHVFMIVLCLGAMYFTRRNPALTLRLHLPIVLPVFFRYAYMLETDLGLNLPELATLKSTLASSLVGVFIIVLTPHARIRVPVLLTAMFSLAMWWMLHSYPHGAAVACISIVGFVAALAWKYFQVAGRYQAAALEVRNRELAKQAERSRMQVELDLASAIQDSVRPESVVTSGPIRAEFFMQKHASVGGDWFAAQVRPHGGLLVLVVDATGKGLQAALVVHAVQSLWTAAMADEHFNPKTWILRVNDVLNVMGKGALHTVTLALADIRRDQIIYWSAGHGPIYVRRLVNGNPKTTAHFAFGNLMGVGSSADFALKPTVVPLDPSRAQTLYLATDGVLVGSARRDVRTIELLERELPARGKEALHDVEIDDDKALVRIHLSPVASAQAS